MSQKCQLFLLAVAWVAIASFSVASEPTSAGARLDALQKAAQLHRDPGTRAITGVTFRRDPVLDAALVDAVLALPGLKELDVSFTRPGAMGYNWIGQIESLESLAMNGLQVTDNDVAFVAKLPNLVSLEARQSRLSEAGVQRLVALPSITELDVSDGLLQEEQLRKIENDNPRITFTRCWEIELVDDKHRLRMNTPVADFLFEAWAAYPNYRRTYTIQVSGPGKYRNKFFAGLKRDKMYEVKINTKKDEVTVTTFFGGEFRLTGDGTQLVFRDTTFDLTGANQTIFVSADEKGEFTRCRSEPFYVLPNHVNGECFNSANGPHFKLFHEAEAADSGDSEIEEPYDGYRGESKGLGYCWLWDHDFKGELVFILWEWPDEVVTVKQAFPSLAWPLEPTGRGVSIVFEGVPHSGRTNKEIRAFPVGSATSGGKGLSLGRSRDFAWPGRPLGYWHNSADHHWSNAHFAHLELTYEDGVCQIKHLQRYFALEFLDRGRKLRCTQSYDPDKLLLPYESDPVKIRESHENREGRLLLERDVSPTADRPLYIIDRDGNFRLSDVPQE